MNQLSYYVTKRLIVGSKDSSGTIIHVSTNLFINYLIPKHECCVNGYASLISSSSSSLAERQNGKKGFTGLPLHAGGITGGWLYVSSQSSHPFFPLLSFINYCFTKRQINNSIILYKREDKLLIQLNQ